MAKHQVRVNQELCKKCGWCQLFCPKNVFGPEGKIVNPDTCLGCKKCGQCQLLCPDGAIYFAQSANQGSARRSREGSYFEGQNPKEAVISPPISKQCGWQFQTSQFALGDHLVSGNEACVMGAIDAGCRFYAGYPITPASEIMHGLVQHSGRNAEFAFIQMEDEIGSIATVVGASKAGAKALTATSGPGFSLMQENLGYAVMTNTPCVIINVQRAGPSTGQPTRPAFGDLMQAIWGCHGDTPKIVLAPTNAQECYDLTIKAFNLAEMYLTPVVILTDETIAHLRERIEISGEIRVFKRTAPVFGDGHELTVTGSTHYLDGLRAASDPKAQQDLLNRLKEKMEKISRYPLIDINCHPQNEVVIISCGFTARSIAKAVDNLNLGNKIGTIVIKMLWPFPFKEIRAAIPHQARVLVPEMNQGQLIHLVREVCNDPILLDQSNGLPIEPGTIQNAIKECLEYSKRG